MAYYDLYVPVIKPTRAHPQFTDRKSVERNSATIEKFDIVLIATNHSCVNYNGTLLIGRSALWTPETPWPACLLHSERCGEHRWSSEKRSYCEARFFPSIHAWPQMSFTIWVISFFFALGLAALPENP